MINWLKKRPRRVKRTISTLMSMFVGVAVYFVFFFMVAERIWPWISDPRSSLQIAGFWVVFVGDCFLWLAVTIYVWETLDRYLSVSGN